MNRFHYNVTLSVLLDAYTNEVGILHTTVESIYPLTDYEIKIKSNEQLTGEKFVGILSMSYTVESLI